MGSTLYELEHLIKHHYEDIRRRIAAEVRDKAVVDDLVQETFARYVQRCQRGLSADDPVGFLKGTASLVVKEFFREEGKRKRFLERLAQDATPQDASMYPAPAPQPSMSDLIRELPETDQQLMLARHRDGLTWQTISQRMQEPLQTLYSRYTRALERLHGLWRDGGESDD